MRFLASSASLPRSARRPSLARPRAINRFAFLRVSAALRRKDDLADYVLPELAFVIRLTAIRSLAIRLRHSHWVIAIVRKHIG